MGEAKNKIKLFEEKQVRAVWDEEAEKWWFSIVDVVAVLTDSVDPTAYWRKLKQRLTAEGNETVTNCHGLKLLAPDGKIRRQAVKCGICKAEMEEKPVTYTEDLEQGVVVIRHVPAHVCTKCGNTWYTGTVAAELEKLVDKYESLAGSEVSVVDFSRLVA